MFFGRRNLWLERRLIEYAEKGATGGALMALQAGADVNHEDWENFSRTALHYAAQGGREALAQVLLGAGANINAADEYGATPLHEAAWWNKPEVAKVLLANGAQVNCGGLVAALLSCVANVLLMYCKCVANVLLMCC